MKLKTVIGSAIAAVGLAACGSSPVTPTVRPVTAAPTVAATVAPTPTLVPTPSPTAAPTPAPGSPLAVLSQGLELKVVNAQGAEQWELTNANLAQIFGVSVPQITNEVTANWPVNSVQVEEAGPNLVLFYNAGMGPTKVAVISHAGKLIGTSSIPDYNLNGGFYVSSPDGTQWAWSVDQSPANQINNLGPGTTYRHHGVVEVAGLGESVHTVYQWLAPAGFTEELLGWYRTGIIIHRFEYWQCGLGQQQIFGDSGAAWFALNPSTGKLTELFTGNRQYLLSGNGVTVAALLNDPHAVLINGMMYSERKSSIDVYGNGHIADISRDGAHVTISRTNPINPCGDYSIPNPTLTVELVTVANHSHVDIPNMAADGWWGNTEFIGQDPNLDVSIYTLQGKPVSELSARTSGWQFQGVLQ
jgi:hypothetical protein